MGRLQDGRIRITAGGPSFEVPLRNKPLWWSRFDCKDLSCFFFPFSNKHIPSIFSFSVALKSSFLALHPQADNQLAQTNSYFIGIFCKGNFCLCIHLEFCLFTRCPWQLQETFWLWKVPKVLWRNFVNWESCCKRISDSMTWNECGVHRMRRAINEERWERRNKRTTPGSWMTNDTFSWTIFLLIRSTSVL